MAKQTQQPLLISSSHVDKTYDLVHLHLWGPYNVSTIQGSKYILTIVNEYSQRTWVYLLKLESDAVLYIKQFLLMIKKQFKRSVKIFRSDNGGEFNNSITRQLFCDLRTIHQTSCAFTLQQNGRVKRKHRHLLNLARAVQFQASIPIRYWGYCILGACYLVNFLPSSVLGGKTSYEVLHGIQQNL